MPMCTSWQWQPLPPHRPFPVFSMTTARRDGRRGVQAALSINRDWTRDLPARPRRRPTAPDRLRVLGKVPLDRPRAGAHRGLRAKPGMLVCASCSCSRTKRCRPTAPSTGCGPRRAGGGAVQCSGRTSCPWGRIASVTRAQVSRSLGLPHRTKMRRLGHLSDLLSLAKHPTWRPSDGRRATRAALSVSNSRPSPRLHESFGRRPSGDDITRSVTWRQFVTLFTAEVPWLPRATRI